MFSPRIHSCKYIYTSPLLQLLLWRRAIKPVLCTAIAEEIGNETICTLAGNHLGWSQWARFSSLSICFRLMALSKTPSKSSVIRISLVCDNIDWLAHNPGMWSVRICTLGDRFALALWIVYGPDKVGIHICAAKSIAMPRKVGAPLHADQSGHFDYMFDRYKG